MSAPECLHAKYGDRGRCGGELLSPYDGLAVFTCQAHHDATISEWARDGQAFQDMLDAGHLDEYLTRKAKT